MKNQRLIFETYCHQLQFSSFMHFFLSLEFILQCKLFVQVKSRQLSYFNDITPMQFRVFFIWNLIQCLFLIFPFVICLRFWMMCLSVNYLDNVIQTISNYILQSFLSNHFCKHDYRQSQSTVLKISNRKYQCTHFVKKKTLLNAIKRVFAARLSVLELIIQTIGLYRVFWTSSKLQTNKQKNNPSWFVLTWI